MPCSSALWNWWDCRQNAVGENEVLPHCVFSHCFQILSEINPRLVYAFKLFKLPFPAKTSFLCIINTVTRCCRCGSLTCYQTIQFPAAPPTSWAFATSPDLPLTLWDFTQQKSLHGPSSKLQLHLQNKVTEKGRNCNASLSWKLSHTRRTKDVFFQTKTHCNCSSSLIVSFA